MREPADDVDADASRDAGSGVTSEESDLDPRRPSVPRAQIAGKRVRSDLARRLAISLSGTQWLWGATFIAWVIMIFGAANIELVEADFDRTARGPLVGIKEHPGERSLRGKPSPNFHTLDYQFVDDHGVTHAGTSYSEEERYFAKPPPTEVIIEYVEGDPSVSRVVGARSRSGNRGHLWFLVLPIGFGSLAIAGAFIKRYRHADRGQPVGHFLVMPLFALTAMVISIVVLLTPR